jgi:hypothetical protein
LERINKLRGVVISKLFVISEEDSKDIVCKITDPQVAISFLNALIPLEELMGNDIEKINEFYYNYNKKYQTICSIECYK